MSWIWNRSPKDPKPDPGAEQDAPEQSAPPPAAPEETTPPPAPEQATPPPPAPAQATPPPSAPEQAAAGPATPALPAPPVAGQAAPAPPVAGQAAPAPPVAGQAAPEPPTPVTPEEALLPPAAPDLPPAAPDLPPAAPDLPPAAPDLSPGAPDAQPVVPERAPSPPAAPGPAPTTEPAQATTATEPPAEPPTEPGPQRPARPTEAGEWRGIVLITGTDTDVGKTIVTAAIAAAAQAAGLRVAVVKPGQTGTAGGGPTDIDLVNRLAHPLTTRTLASYPEPLAPLPAARVAGLAPLELYEVVDAIRAEADKHDLVLVEGAGGLLVPMGVRPSGESWTVADLATTLGGQTVVVARAGLGTLNHTALTLEALDRRGVPAKVVLGAWPAEPELVHWANLTELVPHLVGALPDGAAGMEPGVFQRSAPGWLTPALYGVLDDWRVWADEVS